MKNHTSDCALHNGPAMEPKSCDCGADPAMTPENYGSEKPLKNDEGRFIRPPVDGEEGYGMYKYLEDLREKVEPIEVCNNFEFREKEDGLWLILHGKGTTGQAMFNLGTHKGLAYQTALFFEQDRLNAVKTA